MADLLYGATPPTGKLAETWPLQLADCASTRNFAPQHSRRQAVSLGARVRVIVRVLGLGLGFGLGLGLGLACTPAARDAKPDLNPDPQQVVYRLTLSLSRWCTG